MKASVAGPSYFRIPYSSLLRDLILDTSSRSTGACTLPVWTAAAIHPQVRRKTVFILVRRLT